jgi:hypothetical protein
MTKVCVPPVRERHGELTGCTGVTMEDGRAYRANHRGHIEVDPRTAAQMVANPLAPGLVAVYTGGVPRTAGVICGTCGFAGFAFHRAKPCGRCGADDWDSPAPTETIQAEETT